MIGIGFLSPSLPLIVSELVIVDLSEVVLESWVLGPQLWIVVPFVQLGEHEAFALFDGVLTVEPSSHLHWKG